MTYLIAGIIAVLVFSGALNSFLAADPKWLSKGLRKAGGLAALAFAGWLLLRGQFELAIPVAIGAVSLLGWNGPGGGWGPASWGASFGQRTQATPGQTTSVQSEFLDMTLDHASGRMSGRFIKGRHTGQRLDDLDRADLLQAFAEIDAESASLLEAYLDRREPGWREHAHADAGAGAAPARGETLTQKEAYDILGLAEGAGEEAIREAHRALMKRLHPDQGGSTYLATRVNMAKDVLLRRHSRNS